MFASRLLRGINRTFSKGKDYYKILGVNKNADAAEIKKAFAKMAREYHPDRNTAANAKEKFAEVSEAYQTLSDDSKRKMYDAYGMSGDEQKQYASNGFGGAPDFSNFADFFSQGGMGGMGGFGGFEDFFSMGGQQGVKRTLRGSDVTILVEIEFLDAINGIKKEINYRVSDVCSSCKGSKCKPGSSPSNCTSCQGKGSTTMRQGPMIIQMACQPCNGTGTVIKSPCTACKAQGTAHKMTKEVAEIPKGINSGQTLRMSGKGNIGQMGGQRGDLIIKVNVKPDKYFRREEYNIVTDLSVTISQATLGTEIDVRTLNGVRKLKVPAGASHGLKIRIPGEGVTKLPPNEREKGDHYVVLSVVVPTRLTPEQKALYEQLRKLEEIQK